MWGCGGRCRARMIVVIEQDAEDVAVAKIPKGTDGRANG